MIIYSGAEGLSLAEITVSRQDRIDGVGLPDVNGDQIPDIAFQWREADDLNAKDRVLVVSGTIRGSHDYDNIPHDLALAHYTHTNIFADTPFLNIDEIGPQAGPKLMVRNFSGSLSLLSIDDAQVIQEVWTSSTRFLDYVTMITDLNYDGVPDLIGPIISSETTTVGIVSGKNGELLYALDMPKGRQWFGLRIDALSDFDGDGIDEIVLLVISSTMVRAGYWSTH